MSEAPVCSWFVYITWSYDLDLLPFEAIDNLGRYQALGLGYLKTDFKQEELGTGIIVDALDKIEAEAIALFRADTWLVEHDLPGITSYETDVLSYSEMMVELDKDVG